jgi:hypothetical protein
MSLPLALNQFNQLTCSACRQNKAIRRVIRIVK